MTEINLENSKYPSTKNKKLLWIVGRIILKEIISPTSLLITSNNDIINSISNNTVSSSTIHKINEINSPTNNNIQGSNRRNFYGVANGVAYVKLFVERLHQGLEKHQNPSST